MAGNQRMAGEVWRTYDVKSKGGANFDDADLNHLIGRGWSNNDILKAAAAAGRVDSSTDQRLRALNNEKKKPQMMRVRRGKDGDYEDVDFNSIPEPTKWIANKATLGKVPVGDASEKLYWQGVAADGSAMALRGTRVEPEKEGKRYILKKNDMTWRLPDDYLNSRAAQEAPQERDEPSAPAPVAGVSERFDPAKYALQTPSYTPSYGLNLSSGSDTQERDDSATRATPLFDYVTRGIRDPRGLDKSISSLSSYIG